MTMNLGNHMVSHWEMFKHLVQGEDIEAEATKDFYEEYRSVCDMTAEFYLQTIDVVFQHHELPKGEMTHRGRKVDPGAITDIALLAIEGERDDISGLGQTKAALTIATNLPASDKKYLVADAGHYGIFNGSKWRNQDRPGASRSGSPRTIDATGVNVSPMPSRSPGRYRAKHSFPASAR